MKIHKNLCVAVVNSLTTIFEENIIAESEVNTLLTTNKSWGARDRSFLSEAIYDIVRNYRKFIFLSRQAENEPINYWGLLAVYLFEKYAELPPWNELESFQFVKEKETSLPEKMSLEVRYSIPDWMNEKGEKYYGKNWEKEVIALSHQAKVSIRVNTHLINTDKLIESLIEEGFEVKRPENARYALIIENPKRLTKSEAFKSGYFEIQDLHSQAVLNKLLIKDNEFIIDACAGAGGKSLQLSNMIHNTGKILALDIYEYKLSELQKRAKRNRATNIQTQSVNEDSFQTWKEKADVLVLDVPCSGLGVLKRKPDNKWKMNPERIEEIKVLQSKILNNYSTMLKPGGQMLYITCTIMNDENEEQIENFLKQNQHFRLKESHKYLPSESEFDSFFYALLEKK